MSFTYPNPKCCFSAAANVPPCSKCLAMTPAKRNDSASVVRLDAPITDEVARIQAEIASHVARAEAAEAKLRARGIAIPSDVVAHGRNDADPFGLNEIPRDDGAEDPVEAARRAHNSRNTAAAYERERADARANGGRTPHVTPGTDDPNEDLISAAIRNMHARNGR